MTSTLTSNSTQPKSKRKAQKTRSRSRTQAKPPQPDRQTTLDVLCEQETLSHALNCVGRGVASNPSQPILGTVLFEADADTELLKLSSYNQKFGLSLEVEATINSSGTMALPHLVLEQIARKLPKAENLRLSCSVSHPEPEGAKNLQAVLAPVDDPDKRYELRGMVAEELVIHIKRLFAVLHRLSSGTSLQNLATDRQGDFMNQSNDDRLSILLDPLVQQAVDEAIERHRQRGESIVISPCCRA